MGINDNPVYSYFCINYAKDKNLDAEAVDGFIRDSKYQFIFLFDGLNEISNGKIKSNVTDDIKRLSEKINVSIVLSSRYDNMSFSSDFERYTLSELDEDLIQRRVPDYCSLNEKLKALLHTPFNLTLYTGLSPKSRNEYIESATDLIRLNIKEIRGFMENPESIETIREKEVYFAFNIAFPALAYNLSRENSLSFSDEQFKRIIKTTAACVKEDYFYEDMVDELCGSEKSLVRAFCKLFFVS